MEKDIVHRVRITCSLAGAGLGAVLLASPWLSQADSALASGAGAVFLGALLVRLGLSGVVLPRTWKARARLAVGAVHWLVRDQDRKDDEANARSGGRLG